jgi:hypothetical protein
MARIDEQITGDEIILEVRRIKEELARSAGFDVDRIVEDARRRQQESGRPIVPVPDRESR